MVFLFLLYATLYLPELSDYQYVLIAFATMSGVSEHFREIIALATTVVILFPRVYDEEHVFYVSYFTAMMFVVVNTEILDLICATAVIYAINVSSYIQSGGGFETDVFAAVLFFMLCMKIEFYWDAVVWTIIIILSIYMPNCWILIIIYSVYVGYLGYRINQVLLKTSDPAEIV